MPSTVDHLQILLVDDDPNILLIIERSLLLDPEIAVRPYASPTEALTMLEDSGCRPDLIIADLSMPDMDGIAFLNAIMALPFESYVPIIFLTGYYMADEIERMRKAGAIAVIAKPFDPPTLAGKVRNILQTFQAGSCQI